MKFSVTSVIIPDLDVGETCQLLQRLGFDGVEWRVRYTPPNAEGFSMWGRHKTDLSPDNIASEAKTVRRITEDYGLSIPMIASNVTADDTETIKKLADGAALLGNVPIRVGAPTRYDGTRSYWELYDEAVQAYGHALEILRAAGQRAIVEIHGGTILVSASFAYRLLSNFSSSEIGVIYDVNNMAKDGFETFKMGIELLGEYLWHCHAGGWRPVPQSVNSGETLWTYEGCNLSESILDIRQFVSDLMASGYDQFISIEDFRDIGYDEKLLPQLNYLREVVAS